MVGLGLRTGFCLLWHGDGVGVVVGKSAPGVVLLF